MAANPGNIEAEKHKTYEQLVDTLQLLFGRHPGYRPMNAKGVVCKGTFTAAATARSLSRAPHLDGSAVPITVRLSDFTGIPTISDGDPNASPRGMAIRFRLANGAATELVAHSYNGFPVGTAEEFLEFLRALAAGDKRVPKPTPIETFLASHPRAKEFAEAPKPTPASFATESYYAVNAFRFLNQEGNHRYGRYQIHPVAGEEHLDAKVAATRPASFLFDELEERFKVAPVRFRIVVQVASDTDPITDASQRWPEDRPQVDLGILSIAGRSPDSDAEQRSLGFDPTRLIDGIEASDDPLIQARSEIYPISYQRRNASQ